MYCQDHTGMCRQEQEVGSLDVKWQRATSKTDDLLLYALVTSRKSNKDGKQEV